MPPFRIARTFLDLAVKAHEVRAVATSLQLFNKVGPPFCHEGRKMVQWWYLHFLLPQRSLPSSRELTESRTHSGSRGHRQDLHLLARLAFFMLLFRLFSFGELGGPLPSQKRGGQEVPKVTLVWRIFICGSHIVFAAWEPGLTDCPPFSVGFWNNPNCHMNYLDYL